MIINNTCVLYSIIITFKEDKYKPKPIIYNYYALSNIRRLELEGLSHPQ